MNGELKRLSSKNIEDIICCPGGLEVQEKEFLGDLSRTISWREMMVEIGLEGFIFYNEGTPRGFIEYMPAETAPYPIEAPSFAVIMCFHWATLDKEDEEEHHREENEMLNILIKETKHEFKGLAVLAWDHPVHFPVDMFKELGFDVIEKQDYLSLMYLAFDRPSKKPSLLGPNFESRDLSDQGKVAVDVGFSHRCPYSIHHQQKVKRAVKELDTDDIELKIHEIDTREEAVNYSISPWNWDWVFANGEKVPVHRLEIEEIKDVFREKIIQN
ncbi:MAG: hypothetical protein KGY66_02905 [Candidatus Thermoplasmatota archaeon]|nr:hypothetical protein [Candidatus Thermoplasmatota archaeon]MBS3789844.1 hypothetical protein [Candidatus Thermoplasmatota archaeon]